MNLRRGVRCSVYPHQAQESMWIRTDASYLTIRILFTSWGFERVSSFRTSEECISNVEYGAIDNAEGGCEEEDDVPGDNYGDDASDSDYRSHGLRSFKFIRIAACPNCLLLLIIYQRWTYQKSIVG